MDGITRGKIRLSGRQTGSFQLFMRLIVGRAVIGRGGMTILQTSWRERTKSMICGHKKPKSLLTQKSKRPLLQGIHKASEKAFQKANT